MQRASVYVDGRGQRLGPPKTEGARGEHWLMPTVVALLRRTRDIQDQEREAAPRWTEITYGGEPISRLFTNPTGGLVLRQAVAKVVKQAAKPPASRPAQDPHGRRTVVTTLFVDGDEALDDIARFVGHARPATTAGYVKRLGRRPEAVARRAAAILDADPDDQDNDDSDRSGGVRNHPPENKSNGESYRSGPPDDALPALDRKSCSDEQSRTALPSGTREWR